MLCTRCAPLIKCFLNHGKISSRDLNKDDKSLEGEVTSLYLRPNERVLWIQRFICLGGMQSMLSLIKQCRHFIHLNETDAFRYRHYLELSKQIACTIATALNIAKESCSITDIFDYKTKDQNFKMTIFYAWRYLVNDESHSFVSSKTYQGDYQHILLGSQPHLIDENLYLVLKVLKPTEDGKLNHRNKIARCRVVSESFKLLQILYNINPQGVCYSMVRRRSYWISALKLIFLCGSNTPAEIKMRSSVFESLCMICEASNAGQNGVLLHLFGFHSTLLRAVPKLTVGGNDNNDLNHRFIYEFFLGVLQHCAKPSCG